MEEVSALARDVDFLIPAVGEETGFKIVVLRGADGVDIGVGAVVVGYQQALLGNHTARAAEVQGHNGILEAYLVFVVYFFCAELQSLVLHLQDQGAGD